jgi:Bacterial pre-peptidase C-terminal domain
MKRLSLPIWVIIIILGGLLLSTVLAQTGGYTISAFVVAGGGGSSSAGSAYDLDGTIGQTFTSRISGGSFTLDTGYWALEDVAAAPEISRVYIPQISRSKPPPPTATPKPQPTPTKTPIVTLPCNDVVDNEGENAAAPFTNFGQACIGSFNNPAGDIDDWYEVNLAVGQTITVDLTVIPAGDNYDVYLYIRGNEGAPVAQPINHGTPTESFTYQAPTASRYYIRVYDKTAASVSAKTYVLKASIQ